jgi:hypothetical protein
MYNDGSSPTVTNCTFSGNAAAIGGGMYNFGSSPTVANCTFVGNSGSLGGGMTNQGSPTVTDCTFVGNSAIDVGGGMYNLSGSPAVTNCTFSGNYAAQGGGMNNSCPTTVTNCTFHANDAETGGGMLNFSSSPTVSYCTFSENFALEDGGGMSNYDGSPTVINCTFSDNAVVSDGGAMVNYASSPTLINCTFSENFALEGGGAMVNYAASPDVANCLFVGNTADSGGGMHNQTNSSPTVTNCTFTGNTAVLAGAMWNDGGSPTVTGGRFTGNEAGWGGGMYNLNSSNMTVANCTFSGNSAGNLGGGMFNVNSSPTASNCILWGDSPSEILNAASAPVVTYSDVQGGQPGTGNIDADPQFVDPDNADFRLQPGSPCIDAGDNTAVPEDVTTDLDGNPRFVDDPGTADTGYGEPPIVDRGAYESQPPELVVALDIKPGSCPNSFNRNSHGVLPIALVGTDSFDVSQVDLDSIRLRRKDGAPGEVAPNFGPPGPHPTIEDVAAPFAGPEQCDCHELTVDGIPDLMVHFRTDDVVANLDLNSFPSGALVPLTVTGNTLDGSEFEVDDCVRLVPPGTPPGLLAVTSNLPGAWIDLTPPDDGIDEGGFANFVRTYPLTTEVTLTAPSAQLGWVFVGWNVVEIGFSSNDPVADNFDTLIQRQSITVPIEAALEVVEAVYQQVMLPEPGDGPDPSNGVPTARRGDDGLGTDDAPPPSDDPSGGGVGGR